MFAAKKHQKSDQEDFFIVGLNTDEVFCIVTRKGEHPQPHPRPIQQRFPTQV